MPTMQMAEYSGAGARTQRYGYLPRASVATQVQDANGTYYVHADNLQTPRILTNSAAQIVWRAKYQAYGRATVANDVDGNGITITYNQRSPGQYADAESGLYYNTFRNYDPSAGRYVQSDPIGLRGGINTYAYVDGNPIAGTDPDGLLNQCFVNAAAAVGDQFLFGAGGWLRELLGIDGGIDENSGSYRAGEAVGMLAILLTGEGEAKLVAEGVEALELTKGAEAAADVARVAEEAAEGAGKAFSKEKEALVDMAKADKWKGITSEDMQAYKDLNKELSDPFPRGKVRGPEAHPTGGVHSQQPYGHVGPVNHIPIVDPLP